VGEKFNNFGPTYSVSWDSPHCHPRPPPSFPTVFLLVMLQPHPLLSFSSVQGCSASWPSLASSSMPKTLWHWAAGGKHYSWVFILISLSPWRDFCDLSPAINILATCSPLLAHLPALRVSFCSFTGHFLDTGDKVPLGRAQTEGGRWVGLALWVVLNPGFPSEC
jgi:hypothetical protein